MFLDKNIEAYKLRKSGKSASEIEEVNTSIVRFKRPQLSTSDRFQQN